MTAGADRAAEAADALAAAPSRRGDGGRPRADGTTASRVGGADAPAIAARRSGRRRQSASGPGAAPNGVPMSRSWQLEMPGTVAGPRAGSHARAAGNRRQEPRT